MNKPLLSKIFDSRTRIVALAGNKNAGKTNNLMYLLKDYRASNKDVPIYSYGLPIQLKSIQKSLNIRSISSIRHLINKKDCILVVE